MSTLPSTGETGVIYFVPQSGGSGSNIKDEYVWLSSTQTFEKIGSTDISLAGYVQESQLSNIGNTRMAQLFADWT